MFGMFCLFKDFITVMTFVTDDEQRILLDAIQKAQSEGRSLLMPYCRQNKVSRISKWQRRMRASDWESCEWVEWRMKRKIWLLPTAITPDVNKFNKNDISRMIKNEIKKINLDSSKDKSVSTDVSCELRNTIRADLWQKTRMCDGNINWQVRLNSNILWIF